MLTLIPIFHRFRNVLVMVDMVTADGAFSLELVSVVDVEVRGFSFGLFELARETKSGLAPMQSDGDKIKIKCFILKLQVQPSRRFPARIDPQDYYYIIPEM